ncbi:hypothetical protein V6N13_027169 [Hibiscus sabdariffa]|uniref:Uncharacterized protein n=1 Tax=Hibiscus sabdariffa TaxID=183260 RepID=A0ABR1ZLZ6_9ROSI
MCSAEHDERLMNSYMNNIGCHIRHRHRLWHVRKVSEFKRRSSLVSGLPRETSAEEHRMLKHVMNDARKVKAKVPLMNVGCIRLRDTSMKPCRVSCTLPFSSLWLTRKKRPFVLTVNHSLLTESHLF